MDTIQKTFRDRRLQLGRTQDQVARSAGLSRKTVSDFERGLGGIALENLSRLLLAVGLEVAVREASRRPVLGELRDIFPLDPEDDFPVARRARGGHP